MSPGFGAGAAAVAVAGRVCAKAPGAGDSATMRKEARALLEREAEEEAIPEL